MSNRALKLADQALSRYDPYVRVGISPDSQMKAGICGLIIHEGVGMGHWVVMA